MVHTWGRISSCNITRENYALFKKKEKKVTVFDWPVKNIANKTAPTYATVGWVLSINPVYYLLLSYGKWFHAMEWQYSLGMLSSGPLVRVVNQRYCLYWFSCNCH